MSKNMAKSVSVIEPEKRFEEHYKENKINYFKLSTDIKEDISFDMITAFHVIEHLIDPSEEIRKLSAKLRPNGELVIEVPNSEDALLKLYRSKAFSEFTYWGCHLYLFNMKTLADLAKKAGLQTILIKHVQRYPLANHLYWLSHGKPGGHKKLEGIFDQTINQQYENALASIGMSDTIIGIFQRFES